jgi:DNA-binding NtrC family response regulator
LARILIIDDDETIKKPLKILLEYRGHEVQLAPDGKVGLKMVEESKYDLLITDVVMPNKGGLEAIVDLSRSHPDLPVIAMSGKIPTDSYPIQSLAREFGVSKVLQKPFTKDQFLSAVDNALKTV